MSDDNRRPFLVTDDLEDAPDGAVIFLGRRGWYERHRRMWWPVDVARARDCLEGMNPWLAAPSESAETKEVKR